MGSTSSSHPSSLKVRASPPLAVLRLLFFSTNIDDDERGQETSSVFGSTREMSGPMPASPYRRRKANSDQGKTPDRWDLSQSSAYSETSSVGTSSSSYRRNPLKIAAGVIQSCFSPSSGETLSPREFDSQSTLTPALSTTERRKQSLYKTNNNSTRTQPGEMSFTMADIRKATRNFSPDFKIGQGGFGTVYRARLQDGTFVAIKRAKKMVHDKHLGVEFQSEVSTLACIEHLNLVRFYGYIEHQDERIVIVEYVPNGTLREHLDGGRGFLDLAARLDIAIDIAHAVTYLHMYAGHPIIHRDIKSSNILLTETLRAKVADFGFARAGATEAGVTHVTTQVKGTAGYLDPEYLLTYQLTDKSDVYSFGVLLVELISGRRPIETKREIKERLTPKWAMKQFTDGSSIKVLDPKLPRNPATILVLEKILELSIQCLAPTKQGRPSMRRCAEILWSIRKDYRDMSSSSDPLLRYSNSERENGL